MQPVLFHSFDLCIKYTVSADCKSVNRLIVNRLIVIGLSVNVHNISVELVDRIDVDHKKYEIWWQRLTVLNHLC